MQYLLNNPTFRHSAVRATDCFVNRTWIQTDTDCSDICAIHCSILRYLVTLFRPFVTVSDKHRSELVSGQSIFYCTICQKYSPGLFFKRHRTNCNEYQRQLSSDGTAGGSGSTTGGLSLSECHHYQTNIKREWRQPAAILVSDCRQPAAIQVSDCRHLSALGPSVGLNSILRPLTPCAVNSRAHIQSIPTIKTLTYTFITATFVLS
jgi:hypothetical protein